MARVGMAMMFHDRLKLVATLAGVFFAVVLSGQQAGIFLGLIQKSTMFVSHAGADIWIAPAETEQLQPGKTVAEVALDVARSASGVAWADPILYGIASIARPNGGSAEVSLVGTQGPRYAGGPWNLVAGTRGALDLPDAVIFEDSERASLGDLNLGSIRELNGQRIRAAGFTWGLLPFAPPYAFASIGLARSLMHIPEDRHSFVLVGLKEGADPLMVAKELQRQLPETRVMTRQQLERSIVRYMLLRTALGVSMGASTLFGLFIGFVTVSLSMFSSVVDRLREFGTLKALGATNSDLARLLATQALAYAAIGTVVGLAVLLATADLLRTPSLAAYIPPIVVIATALVMTVLCVAAAMMSLIRLRKLEPGMVFR
jgi:putative ABC transport system permease protein